MKKPLVHLKLDTDVLSWHLPGWLLNDSHLCLQKWNSHLQCTGLSSPGRPFKTRQCYGCSPAVSIS